MLRLCLASNAMGASSSVITLDRIKQHPSLRLPLADTASGIPVTRIPFHGSWRYPIAPGVLAAIRDADVVHVHGIDFFFDFLAATQRFHRKPLFASTHGGFFHTTFAHRLKRLYFQTATRQSARAYAMIGASSQSDYAMFEPIARRNLMLAENGVDTDKWSDVAARVPTRTLLALGRFSSNKQLTKLFTLLQHLRRLDDGWTLIVAGRESDVSGSDLAESAERSGVAGAVQIVGNPSDPEIGSHVRHASYIVSASRYEGFGIAVIEGMAAGLIPVLNRIPPFEALHQRARCGLLFDIDDAARAARLIEDLHLDTLHAGGGARARCMAVAATFSWSRTASLFCDRYRAAMAPR